MSDQNYPLYSCDDHLDMNAVPPDVWTSRASGKHREDVPHVVDREGQPTWIAGGRFAGVSGSYGGSRHLTALSRAGLESDPFRPGKPKERMEDMERDEIYASLVYGPFALFAPNVEDAALKKIVLQGWNDWAAEEFNAYMPDRLSAFPFLPLGSPEEASEELERCARLGHRGAIVNPSEMELRDPAWDRLWQTATDVDLPLSFHIGGGASVVRPKIGTWEFAAFGAVVPMQIDEPLAIMIYSGALERNPGLKLVLAESGVGWLPYFVHRLDAIFEKHCAPNPEYSIKTRPTELFERQVWATFEEEPLGPDLIPLLNPDNFMWACDYPHPDSTWPESRKAIEHSLSTLGPEAVRKVTSDNCRKLYRL